MHELSLAQGVVRRTVVAAQEAKAKAVRRIFLRIGELAGVDGRQLTSAFEVVRGGTICDGAVLDIEFVAASWSCPTCAVAIESGAPLRCPTCGIAAQLAKDADALSILRIELEVDGV